jgi:predicted nucleotidyltransferase
MDREITELVREAARLLKAAGARDVYVFGSALSSNRRDDSDIDLAVSGLAPERYFAALGDVADALHKPVDLVDLDQPTPFTRHLSQSGALHRVE